MRQSSAVMAHDVSAQLGKISAPTQITVGSVDQIRSTRFAVPMKDQIRGAELVIFKGCAHAHIYEQVEEFNAEIAAIPAASLRRRLGIDGAAGLTVSGYVAGNLRHRPQPYLPYLPCASSASRCRAGANAGSRSSVR